MRALLIPAWLFAAAALAAGAEPDFQPGRVDFGRQPQNRALTARVRLTNPTAAPLVIQGVESDCACTTGEAAPLRLAPGASAEITVHVQTGASEGSFRHNLFVLAGRERLTLPISAEIYRYADWTISPPRLIFTPSTQGSEAGLELRLDYRGPGPLAIATATSDSPWIEIGRPRIEGRSAVFILRKLPAAPAGSIATDIRIATRDKASPVLVIPVFAYVTAP